MLCVVNGANNRTMKGRGREAGIAELAEHERELTYDSDLVKD